MRSFSFKTEGRGMYLLWEFVLVLRLICQIVCATCVAFLFFVCWLCAVSHLIFRGGINLEQKTY